MKWQGIDGKTKQLKFTKNEKKIIETIAKKSELILNFDDVMVFSNSKMPLAFYNVENRTLYINTNSEILSFKKLLSHLEGIITHETGHSDSRLLVPYNLENAKRYLEFCKKKKIDKSLLNFVCDMEIHYQYNSAKFIKPIQRLKLIKFLTEIRNYCFELDKNDLILSLNYQFTNEQKGVKKIIEDRNIGILEKVEKISKIVKRGKQKMPTEITGLILGSDENGKGKGKGKKDKSIKNAKSIRKQVEKRGEEGEIAEKLSNMGFSNAEIKALLDRENKEDLLEKIGHLDKSFNTILPSIEEANTKEKTNERTHSKGYRLNGYHKIRDITEVTENVEDLVTIGKYDFNDIHIPTKIDRKQVGIVIILRDVSGSIGGGNLAKLVRDTTVGIIQLAKRKSHRIGVVDFHSDVEPIRDSNREILTREYNTLMLDSMKFKYGYSTRLSKALDFINNLVKEKNMQGIPINIFIVSDGYVDETGKFDFVSKRVNLIGIWCRKFYGDKEDDALPTDIENVDRDFIELFKNNDGKIYQIARNSGKLLMLLMKDYAG